MLKNLLYAILLGVGMAACLADRDSATEDASTNDPVAETTEALAPAPDPAAFVIAAKRVGSIRIGMPVAELRQLNLPARQLRDTTLSQEGQDYTAYVYRTTGNTGSLLVEQQCESGCQVWRIQVQDNEFKTAQGLGIGSKYADVQQHYPISFTGLGDAGFVAVSEAAGITFILDTSQLDKTQIHRLQPDQIPANTLIKGILVY